MTLWSKLSVEYLLLVDTRTLCTLISSNKCLQAAAIVVAPEFPLDFFSIAYFPVSSLSDLTFRTSFSPGTITSTLSADSCSKDARSTTIKPGIFTLLSSPRCGAVLSCSSPANVEYSEAFLSVMKGKREKMNLQNFAQRE